MKSKILIFTFIYIIKTIYCSSLNKTSNDIVNKAFNLPLYNKTSELIDNAYIKNETKNDETIHESSSNFGIRIIKPPNLKALEIENKILPVKNIIKNEDEKKQIKSLSSKLYEKKWDLNKNLKENNFNYEKQKKNNLLNQENHLKQKESAPKKYTYSYIRNYYPNHPKIFKKFKTYENNFEYDLPNKNWINDKYPIKNKQNEFKEDRNYQNRQPNLKSFNKLIRDYKNNNYFRNNINKYDYNDLNIKNNSKKNQLSYQENKKMSEERYYTSKPSKYSNINFSHTNSPPIIIKNIDYGLFLKMNPYFDYYPNHLK